MIVAGTSVFGPLGLRNESLKELSSSKRTALEAMNHVLLERHSSSLSGALKSNWSPQGSRIWNLLQIYLKSVW